MVKQSGTENVFVNVEKKSVLGDSFSQAGLYKNPKLCRKIIFNAIIILSISVHYFS